MPRLSLLFLATLLFAATDRDFLGTWKLLSYEVRYPDGRTEKPFGDRPLGRIHYQANGQMSAQLMNPDAPRAASPNALDATPTEAAATWRNYIGYWGAFKIDHSAGTVTHFVEGSWFPNWIGQQQVRRFRLQGRRLTLEAISPYWHTTLVWEKLP